MQRPLNLISDSSLVQEIFDLIRERGGSATFVQIADSILRLSNPTHDLAEALVNDLIQNDPRFNVEESCLTIKESKIETLVGNNFRLSNFDIFVN
jgi:hypothetical protein